MGERGGTGGVGGLSGDRRVTVTLPVALPLLALALGRPGATLGIDSVSFLDRTDGENDGFDRGASGSHVFDEAGDAHCSPSLGRICMTPPGMKGNLPNIARA